MLEEEEATCTGASDEAASGRPKLRGLNIAAGKGGRREGRQGGVAAPSDERGSKGTKGLCCTGCDAGTGAGAAGAARKARGGGGQGTGRQRGGAAAAEGEPKERERRRGESRLPHCGKRKSEGGDEK
jgi:hypothetical protein